MAYRLHQRSDAQGSDVVDAESVGELEEKIDELTGLIERMASA